MKKLLFAFTIICLLVSATGCDNKTKVPPPPSPKPDYLVIISATSAAFTDNARTAPGIDFYSSIWTKGDAIGVYYVDPEDFVTSNVKYQLEEGYNDEKVSPFGTEGVMVQWNDTNDEKADHRIYGVYPYKAYAENRALEFTIPTVQSQSKPDSFDLSGFPMICTVGKVAKALDAKMEFIFPYAMIDFMIDPRDSEIEGDKFVSLTIEAEESLAGDVQYDIIEEKYSVPEEKTATLFMNSVSLEDVVHAYLRVYDADLREKDVLVTIKTDNHTLTTEQGMNIKLEKGKVPRIRWNIQEMIDEGTMTIADN